MRKYYLASFILHSLFFLPGSSPSIPKDAVPFTLVETQKRPAPIPEIDEGKERRAAKKELGDENLLTRKATVYKTYIDRIGEKLYYRWKPVIEKLVKGKKIRREYSTILWLIIDKRGYIERTLLIQASGYPGLDEASVEAARGQYVPNPPKSLIEADGYGRLVWRFVLYAD